MARWKIWLILISTKKKFIKQSQCNERAPKLSWDIYYQGLAVNYGTSKGLLTPWVLDFIHQL
jgi:hypothetical protein